MVGRLEFGMVSGRGPSPLQHSARPRAPDDGFHVIVLGNFSGWPAAAAEPGWTPVLQHIDIDSFDLVLSRMTAGLTLTLPELGGSSFGLTLNSLEDFEPDALFGRLPLFKRLRELRARLNDGDSFEAAAAELKASGIGLTPALHIRPTTLTAEGDGDTLARLLGRPQTGHPPEREAQLPVAGESAVTASLDRLLRGVLAPYVQPAMAHLQQPLVEAVDLAIGDAMRRLLRNPAWRELESAWHSVDRFLRELDAPTMSLTLIDAPAAALAADLAGAGPDWAASALAKSLAARLQREGPATRPALVVGLYAFGISEPELSMLGGLAAVSAEQGAMLLASAAPTLLAERLATQSLEAASTDAAATDAVASIAQGQARWQALRDSRLAHHVTLLYPRVLGRMPYGPKTQPVSAFDFDELADGFAHERLAWRTAALDAAALLAVAHAEAGWEFDLATHRVLGHYPAFTDRSRSESALQACAEFYWSEQQLAAIADHGLVALVSDARSSAVRLAPWRSIAADGATPYGPWASQ